MSIDNQEELTQALAEIEKWEQDQRGLWFWEKLGRLPFAILDRLTPKFIQDKIGQIIDEIGGYVQTGGKYLIREQDILHMLVITKLQIDSDGADLVTRNGADTVPLTLEQAKELPLGVMDTVAIRLGESRKKIAFVQGATTGFGGIFTLALDVPAVLGISLKVLQEMAICYGFDPQTKEERIFIVKCLQFSSSDIVGKKAILDELAFYDDELQQKQVVSQIQGWRETVTTYIDNFGWKKLFQMIPIAGMVFGAFLNKSTVEDVAETGRMLYRKRRILMKLKEQQ
jgi:hypothetical protein